MWLFPGELPLKDALWKHFCASGHLAVGTHLALDIPNSFGVADGCSLMASGGKCMTVLGIICSTLMYDKISTENKVLFLTSSKHLPALFYSFDYNTTGKKFRNVRIKKRPRSIS